MRHVVGFPGDAITQFFQLPVCCLASSKDHNRIQCAVRQKNRRVLVGAMTFGGELVGDAAQGVALLDHVRLRVLGAVLLALALGVDVFLRGLLGLVRVAGVRRDDDPDRDQDDDQRKRPEHSVDP